MGYGLIAIEQKQMHLIEMNTLRVPAKLDAYQRLELIFFTVQQIIHTYRPTDFAIEAPFFGKNVQSMLKLGRAQGVAIAAAMQSGIPVTEYAPRKIKQSITGNGNATKEQVAAMLQTLLSFKETPQFLDATDGLAVAVCHAFQKISLKGSASIGGGGKKSKASGWAAFVKDNTERVSGAVPKKKWNS